MTTLFISDLHLDETRPGITGLFERFLREQAPQASALYILGDLFEVWVGDDDDTPLAENVRRVLKETSTRLPVWFMAGNRDFLVGERFAEETGVSLLAEPTTIDLYGTPTLLMHGDTLCTDDHEYQAYRQVVREPAWQKDVLSRSLTERRALADQFRADSEMHTSGKTETIMDVNADAVAEAFRQHGVNLMIHGHTHRLDVHSLRIDDRVVQRIVLGDWYEQGNVLRVDESGFRLQSIPLRGNVRG